MVEVQSYVPANPEEDAWGLLTGGGIAKFDRFAYEQPVGSGQYLDLPLGTSYTGIVAENPKSYHAQDYDTKSPKFYKSGQPIMEVSIILDTDYRDTEEDDGRRIMRLGYIGKAALKQEMDRLNIKRFGVGTRLTVTFTGYKPNASGRASKLVNIELVPAEFVPAQQQAVDAVMSQAGYVEAAQQAGFPTQAQQAAPVQQAPVQAVVPQPAPTPPPVQVFAAQAPVAQPAPQETVIAGLNPTLDTVAVVRLLITNGIPRQNALEGATSSAFRNAGLAENAADMAAFQTVLDTLEANAPR